MSKRPDIDLKLIRSVGRVHYRRSDCEGFKLVNKSTDWDSIMKRVQKSWAKHTGQT